MFWPNPRSALLLLAVAAGCGGSGSGQGSGEPTPPPSPTSPAAPPSAATGPTVQATRELAFTPGQVTVGSGGTVTWVFGPVAHNVVFASGGGTAGGEYGGSGSGGGGPSNIPTTSNASTARTFGAAGTFRYACTIHPGMTGTVTVR